MVIDNDFWKEAPDWAEYIVVGSFSENKYWANDNKRLSMKTGIVYYCNNYGFIDHVKNEWEIIAYRPTKEENEVFTKDMLEDRMVVENREGKRYIVIDDKIIRKNGYDELSEYDEFMKSRDFPDLDIMKVYGKIRVLDQLSSDKLNLLWTRTPEDTRLSKDEVIGLVEGVMSGDMSEMSMFSILKKNGMK